MDCVCMCSSQLLSSPLRVGYVCEISVGMFQVKAENWAFGKRRRKACQRLCGKKSFQDVILLSLTASEEVLYGWLNEIWNPPPPIRFHCRIEGGGGLLSLSYNPTFTPFCLTKLCLSCGQSLQCQWTMSSRSDSVTARFHCAIKFEIPFAIYFDAICQRCMWQPCRIGGIVKAVYCSPYFS